MRVDTLQQFLRSLVPALRGAGDPGHTARDLEDACRRLEPFRDLGLAEFAAFLARADEYRRTGAVRVPAAADLEATALLDAVGRLAGLADARSLEGAQADVRRSLEAVSAEAGLTVTVKPVRGWAEGRLARARIAPHVRAVRELVARIDSPDRYADPAVQDGIAAAGRGLDRDGLKALAAEFGVSVTARATAERVITEALAKMTGHAAPPAKAGAGRKAAAAADPAVIDRHAQRLKELMERANDPDLLPESEVEAELAGLHQLPKATLFEIVNQAGIEGVYKKSTAEEILRRVRNRLTVGRRADERAKV